MAGNTTGVIDPRKNFRCGVEFQRVGMVKEIVQGRNISRRRRCSAKASFKCTSLCFAYFSGMKVVAFAYEKYFYFNKR